MQLAARDLSAFAFVFDMNRVFEAFVVNFVRRHRHAILPPDLWDYFHQPWRQHDLLHRE